MIPKDTSRQSRPRRLLLVAASAILLSTVVTASGPWGGNVQALAFDAGLDGPAWAVLESTPFDWQESQVFVSRDRGLTWERAAVPDGRLATGVVTEASRPGVVYVVMNDVLRSLDAGVTFTSLGAGILALARASGVTLDKPDVYVLAVHRTHPEVLWAASRKLGVIRSTDGGITWTRGGLHASIVSLEPSPSEPAVAWVAVQGQGVLKSVDGGATFLPSREGLLVPCQPECQPRYFEVGHLRANPAVPGEIWGSGREWDRSFSVVRSSDGGATWTHVTVSEDGPTAVDIALDTTDPLTVIALLWDQSVHVSRNGGASWQEIRPAIACWHPCSSYQPADNARVLAADPADPAVVLVGTTVSGVVRSADAGETWLDASHGLTELDVWSLAADPSRSGAVWAATYDRGVFSSRDGGGTWSGPGSGMEPPDCFVGAGPCADNIGPRCQSTTSVAVETGTDQVFAGTWQCGTFGSADAGVTWQGLSTSASSYMVSLWQDPTSQTLYTTRGSRWDELRLYRSTDRGVSWQLCPAPNSSPIRAVTIKESTGTLLVVTGTNALVSEDHCDTWSLVQPYALSGCATQTAAVSSAAFQGGESRSIVLGTRDCGVWTVPGGIGFPWVKTSTSDLASNDVEFDRGAPDRAWTAGATGLSVSNDAGLTWAPFPSWPAGREATALEIDGDGRRLYVGTRSGVVTLQLPRPARRHLDPVDSPRLQPSERLEP